MKWVRFERLDISKKILGKEDRESIGFDIGVKSFTPQAVAMASVARGLGLGAPSRVSNRLLRLKKNKL